ncbi:MAG: hydrolase [Candidatus Nephthysia bennettiae]|uniref:Cysteine hydrolase n=1 Tax=Candidatus Nephthysia bennettiae TaxID=3127016 RepID=A0A934N756_9BACT|nr:cysteine hydrolase [Candidatus Dormibacteraeota bacterium]MBJ7613967.1 cysteine hydrolase [Candidatus Dormibacteraeota bacterium]PZR88459.1 MAG: hydrolase [Candidatus Dormibacteraeota bacterium]
MSNAARIDPGATAVVLNDMINSGLRKKDDEAYNSKIEQSGLIANAARLVAEARARGIPVIWIRVGRRPDRADVVDNLVDVAGAWHQPNRPVAPGSHEAANVDELPVHPEDQVVLKPRIDPFIGTDLDLQLRARRVETILLGGYSTNIGVESCARTAHDLGYNVVTVSDCCWNIAADLHEFSIQRILPRFSRVMTADAALGLLGPR